jgi:hypothetical protein
MGDWEQSISRGPQVNRLRQRQHDIGWHAKIKPCVAGRSSSSSNPALRILVAN